MSNESVEHEINYRFTRQADTTVNNAMEQFRRLLIEIDCMTDEGIEEFQDKLHNHANLCVTNRRKAFTISGHDATIYFLTYNRGE